MPQIPPQVNRLREKVSQHQREIILVSRLIEHSRFLGGIVGSESSNILYAEAGVISGELSAIEYRIFEIIRPLYHTEGNSAGYRVTADLEIPVQKKLRGRFSSYNSIFLHLSPNPEEFLSQNSGNEILLSTSEFLNLAEPALQNFFTGRINRRDSYTLKDLEILIGEKEIRRFAKTQQVKKKQIDDFFQLFQEGEMEKRFAQYNYERREELAQRFASSVAQLALTEEEINHLHPRLESLSYSRYRGQDGSLEGKWSDWEVISSYDALKNSVARIGKEIQTLLEYAKRIKLEEHPSISGFPIFPAQAPVKDYMQHVISTIERVDSTVKKINSELKEKKRNKWQREE